MSDIKIKKIHGSRFKAPNEKTELNIYKKYNLIYCENILHCIIIGKKLFNLVVYNESEHEIVLELLIENKYDNISFDFNHIHQRSLIISMLDNFYNMPYILTDSKIQLPTFNFIFKPDLDKININYVVYMLEQYNNGYDSICNAWATFNKKSLQFIRSQITDTNIKGVWRNP